MPRTVPTGRARPSRTSGSWRQADPARAGLRPWPVTAAVMAFALGLAVAFGIGAMATPAPTTEQKIADLQRSDAERDVKQVATLTELARGSADRLAPVLNAMAAAMPVAKGAAPGPAPTPDVIRGWRDVVSKEVTSHADSPSAGTAVNVARGGLRAAVQQLNGAVDLFDAAVGAPEALRAQLTTLAGQQRTLALRTWSVAAVQLDVINIDAGYGHAHVQLPAGPESGAIAPDNSPEGSGRR